MSREISQRDLKMRSKEIMDAVEHGATFTVTRDGREIGELVPLRRQRTFMPVDDFLALGDGLAPIDPDIFRTDIDSTIDPYTFDPYDR